MRHIPEITEDEMVKLPYGTNLFLCPHTLQRWAKAKNGYWERDSDGESDWKKMGSYVGESYRDVASRELKYALAKK